MAGSGAATPGDRRALIERLFETSAELMFVIGPDGVFRLVNPAWTQATGWREDELLGRLASEMIHPEDLAAFGEHVERLLTEGSSRNLARVLMSDGSWRWFEGRAQLNGDGHIIGSLRDAARDMEQTQRLERSERSRQLLSEAAGVGFWSYEPGSGEVIWSDDILKGTGYTPDEIRDIGKLKALLDPAEAEVVLAAFARGVTEGVGQSIEHRMRAKDGRWVTLRATFRCEPRPEGGHALFGISQNVTEVVAARDMAQRGEQQARQLVECAPFAVAMFDRALSYMVVSPQWEAAFSLGGRDHIGRTLPEVFPEVPIRFLHALHRALAGEVVACPEDCFVDSQGGGHWIRWEARPWRDASGRIGGVVAYVDDISALALARREAVTNAQRLKLALSAAAAGVYEVDHLAQTFWASPEFGRVVGRRTASFEDVLDMRFPDFHPDDVEHVRESFRAIRDQRGRRAGSFDARIFRPGSGERWVRVFHQVRCDRKGRPVKAVGLVMDVDERKRQELALVAAERAAQAGADAKAAFLANMSHEIRTPLNGVMGVLHLLQAEDLSEDGRSLLGEALSCGQMLGELLNDVIDFSKIEAGRLELVFEPVDPAALAQGVARLLSPQAQAKGLDLRVEADTEGLVSADPVRLRQALFNLAGNAVKFTLQGSVTVRALDVAAAGGRRLRFEVEDTGVGVPAEVQPRIFQRFDQGDASTTRRFGGSGLGLSITQRLAELMGGQVGFRSVEGEGSLFWLELPVEAADAPAAVDPEAAAQVLDGLRVLVVEDNPTNRLIATKLLEQLGAAVETAADGYEGVEAARRGFDLILMDVQMPGIDGPEAARRIRRLEGAAASTPIVALTANVLAHQRRAYLEAGMDGVVGKPISPSALLAEIARLAPPADCEEAAA